MKAGEQVKIPVSATHQEVGRAGGNAPLFTMHRKGMRADENASLFATIKRSYTGGGGAHPNHIQRTLWLI